MAFVPLKCKETLICMFGDLRKPFSKWNLSNWISDSKEARKKLFSFILIWHSRYEYHKAQSEKEFNT